MLFPNYPKPLFLNDFLFSRKWNLSSQERFCRWLRLMKIVKRTQILYHRSWIISPKYKTLYHFPFLVCHKRLSPLRYDAPLLKKMSASQIIPRSFHHASTFQKGSAIRTGFRWWGGQRGTNKTILSWNLDFWRRYCWVRNEPGALIIGIGFVALFINKRTLYSKI